MVNTVHVGKNPDGIAVNPNTNMIYVAQYGSRDTLVIDGKSNKVVNTLPVGKGAEAVAVNPNTNMIYVANYDDNTVSLLNTTMIYHHSINDVFVGNSPEV